MPLLEYGHLSGARDSRPTSRCSRRTRFATRASRSRSSPPRTRRPRWRRSLAITADFEEQPALLDVRKAFDADAPQIHQWGNWYPHFEGEMDRRQIRKGNIDEAFDKADLIVQGVYRPAAIEHVPIETQVAPGRARAERPPDDLLVHAGALLLDGRRRRAPAAAAEPAASSSAARSAAASAARSTPPPRRCARCSRMKSGRPVKWRWTREEEFLCSSTRAPWHMEIAGRGHEGRLDPRPQDADAARLAAPTRASRRTA